MYSQENTAKDSRIKTLGLVPGSQDIMNEVSDALLELSVAELSLEYLNRATVDDFYKMIHANYKVEKACIKAACAILEAEEMKIDHGLVL